MLLRRQCNVFVWKSGSLDLSRRLLLFFLVPSLDFIGFGVELEESGSGESKSLEEKLEKRILVVVIGRGDLIRLTSFALRLLISDSFGVGFHVDFTVHDLAAEENVRDGHSVLGEGTSLIGANARGGTEGLNRLQVLNKHKFLGHTLGSKGQGHCDSGEETLRDVSDNDTDGEDEHINSLVLNDNETVEEERDTEGDSDDGDQDNESLNLVGKRSLLGLSGVSQVGNSADSSVITSSEDNTLALTVGTVGTEESDVGRLKHILVDFASYT